MTRLRQTALPGSVSAPLYRASDRDNGRRAIPLGFRSRRTSVTSHAPSSQTGSKRHRLCTVRSRLSIRFRTSTSRRVMLHRPSRRASAWPAPETPLRTACESSTPNPTTSTPTASRTSLMRTLITSASQAAAVGWVSFERDAHPPDACSSVSEHRDLVSTWRQGPLEAFATASTGASRERLPRALAVESQVEIRATRTPQRDICEVPVIGLEALEDSDARG
jgi:hypothetical protein